MNIQVGQQLNPLQTWVWEEVIQKELFCFDPDSGTCLIESFDFYIPINYFDKKKKIFDGIQVHFCDEDLILDMNNLIYLKRYDRIIPFSRSVYKEKERQVKNFLSLEVLNFLGFDTSIKVSSLEGSEKQKKWAEGIRKKQLINCLIEFYCLTGNTSKHYLNLMSFSEEATKKGYQVLKRNFKTIFSITSSAFFIGYKDLDFSNCVGEEAVNLADITFSISF